MMDSAWIHEILNWVSQNPAWSSLLVFTVACIESLALVGIIIPGIVFLFGVGAMIGLGAVEFLPVSLCGSAGALLGDVLSFALGRRYREHLVELRPFSRYPQMLNQGARYFHRHGAKSVVAGRFIGPLRPVIPATAGMLGMSPGRFVGIAIPACLVWTPAYLLPGMLFGASLEVASEYAGRLTLVLVIVVAVLWSTWWVIRGAYAFLAGRSARWMRRAIHWARRHPVLGRITGPLLDPSQPEVLSVTMLGILLVLTLWSFALLLFLSPFAAQPEAIDQAVLARAEALRNHIADPVMVAITQLSRWWVLLPASAAVLLWLLGANRTSAAGHWLVAMGGGVALQFLLGWTLRATPLLQGSGYQELYLPSPALTLTTVVLGFFAVMVARELRRSHRKWPYLAAAILLTLLMLARLYLGLDWLSGALVGVLLGLSWTAVVGIAYRQRALRPFSGAVVSLIFFGTLTATMYWQVGERMRADLDSMQLELPQKIQSAERWWQSGWQDQPRERTQLRSVQARRFNLQVAADPGRLAEALAQSGWQRAEPAGWPWLMQALNPDPDAGSLPLLRKDYLGKAEVLFLQRRGPQPGSQQTVRLWDSGTRLEPGEQPLLLGQFVEEQLVRRFRVLSYWRAVPAPDAELQAFAAALGAFSVWPAESGLLLIRPGVVTEIVAGSPPAAAAGPVGREVPAAPAARDSGAAATPRGESRPTRRLRVIASERTGNWHSAFP
ncbi:MAG: hypothetical protein GTN86_06880 [Xanthomonadales bacterium]|nr:hypothetical protein [Xanthomonadales bacterium]NIN60614.1 hypothetical protein [Xanthomonadales bacterium]NIN75966.1 hypothetical protein [Xanthomonadales bacterium]NIP13007.1 hypothetical protein [Xanthomonadales bacterium]NIP77540.1 hypothetical protein [Xanthomonadales bacterium]